MKIDKEDGEMKIDKEDAEMKMRNEDGEKKKNKFRWVGGPICRPTSLRTDKVDLDGPQSCERMNWWRS